MTRRTLTVVRLLAAIYWAGLFYGTHKPHLSINLGVEIANLDKLLHMVCFGGLAVWLTLSRLGRRPLLWATLIVLVYLPIDELTQHWMQPQRTLDFYDVLAGAVGVLAVAAIWSLVRYLRRPARSFVDHARLVSAITLFSRFFGLARDAALGFALGFGWVYDAFVIAFMIPNLFRRLFGEGALAGAFIPHYAKLDKHDPPTARRFALLVIEILFAGLALVALVLSAALVLAGQLAPDLADKWFLAGQLTVITIWYMPLVCLTALLSAMLQVHRRFAVPAAAPVLLNVLVIAAALTGYALTRRQPHIAMIVGAAVCLAGLVQVAWVRGALGRAGARPGPIQRPAGLLADPAVRRAAGQLVRQWLPTTIGLAVFQLNVLGDVLIAMFFSAPTGQTCHLFGHTVAYPMIEGDVAVLGATARLYEFPLGVFAIAIATAIFPALARAADRPVAFARLLRQGLRLALFIGLPAGVGLILVRSLLTGAIYPHWGHIGAHDADRIAWVLVGYASAIWAYSCNQLLTRAFYAHHNPFTPMRIACVMLVLNLTLNLTLIWPMGVAGLAWSTAGCATLQCALLLWHVRRYTPGLLDRSMLVSAAKTAVLTVVMTAAVAALVGQVNIASLGWAEKVGLLIGAVALGALVVLGGAVALKMDELRWVLGRHRSAEFDPTHDAAE